MEISPPKVQLLKDYFLNLNLINMNLDLGKILFTAAIPDEVNNSFDFSAFVCQSIVKHKDCDLGDCDS